MGDMLSSPSRHPPRCSLAPPLGTPPGAGLSPPSSSRHLASSAALAEQSPHEGAAEELAHAAPGYPAGDAAGSHRLDVTEDMSAPVEAPSHLWG